MNDGLMRMVFSLLNMLGVAGVGTYLSGRKKMGVIQIIISLTFFSLTLLPMLYLVRLVHQTEGTNFIAWQIGIFQGQYMMRAEYFPPFLIALGAIMVFGVNLVWSLTTTKPLKDSPPPLP